MLIIATLLLFTGCSSVVKSTKVANVRSNAHEGVVYSLPKQLVKVTYKCEILDEAKAAAELEKAIKALTEVEAKITAIETKIKDQEKLISEIPKNADEYTATKQELNIELTKMMTEKVVLLLAKLSAERNKALKDATHKSAQAKDKAPIESFTFAAEEAAPDPKQTYAAAVNHVPTKTDDITITTTNGLLDSASGFSEDKTADIVVSLVSAVAGLTPSFQSASDAQILPSAKTVPKPASKTFIVDPSNSKSILLVNQFLESNSSSYRIESKNSTTGGPGNDPNTSPAVITESTVVIKSVYVPAGQPLPKMPKAGKKPDERQRELVVPGIAYRQPGIAFFSILHAEDGCNYSVVDEVPLVLAQAGTAGYIALPGGAFSKNEYDIVFSKGLLKKRKISQPSEVFGFVKMFPDALTAIFAIPTSLIKLKLDYSTSDAAIATQQKALLEAQIAILGLQADLEKASQIASESE